MRCVATTQNNACVQEITLDLLNLVDVLAHTDTPIRYLAEMAGNPTCDRGGPKRLQQSAF